MGLLVIEFIRRQWSTSVPNSLKMKKKKKVKKNVNPDSGCRERGCMVENRTCTKIQLYSETGNPCAGAVLRFILAGTPVEEKNIAWKFKGLWAANLTCPCQFWSHPHAKDRILWLEFTWAGHEDNKLGGPPQTFSGGLLAREQFGSWFQTPLCLFPSFD